MTAPRQVLRNSTYLVTRRCSDRRFLLRPSKTVSDVFRYLLAVASKRFGVEVHAFCVMSNHVHLLVTDREARLPQFQQYLDSLVARAVNASYGRWEHFWAPGSFHAMRLETPRDIVAKAAYILVNPVKAGLVRTGRIWPGLWSAPEHFGSTIHAERPQHFFSKRGRSPTTVDLELTVPPGFDSVDEFRRQVVALWTELEHEARRECGGEFLGLARVLRQDPRGRPRSREPRRKLRPRVASRDTARRIEALMALREFERQYRIAFAKRRSGDMTAIFPAGTYLMRVLHGAPCAAVA